MGRSESKEEGFGRESEESTGTELKNETRDELIAEKMNSTLSLENSKVIFVSGFGGPNGASKAIVQETCWTLHSLVYNESPRHRIKIYPGLSYIINKSTHKTKVSKTNVKQLQQMLFDMPLDDPDITRVVFAHCHGAKIIYEALKEDSLSSFLKSKGICDPSNRIKEIRAHLAVIIFGGIQVIPVSFSKICTSIEFKDDGMAKGGRMLYGETHKETIERVVIEKDGSTSSVNSKKVCSSLEDAEPIASSALGFVSPSFGKGRHYMLEYINSEEVKNKVLSILGVNDVEEIHQLVDFVGDVQS